MRKFLWMHFYLCGCLATLLICTACTGTTTPSFPLEEKWRFETSDLYDMAVDSNDKYVVAIGKPAYVLNAETGSLVQKIQPNRSDGTAEAALFDDAVMLADGDRIATYHLPDGEMLWEYQSELGWIDFPLLGRMPEVDWEIYAYSDYAYIDEQPLGIRILDAKTGKLLWDKRYLRVDPLRDGDTLYITGVSEFNAHDISNGDQRWEGKFSIYRGYAHNGIAYGGYITTGESEDEFTYSVSAYDLEKRTLVWRTKMSRNIDKIVGDDRRVFVLTMYGVFCIDAQTGQILWRQAVQRGNDIVMMGERVYINEFDTMRLLCFEQATGADCGKEKMEGIPIFLQFAGYRMEGNEHFLYVLCGKILRAYGAKQP